MNKEALLHTAVMAARVGGERLMAHFGNLNGIRKKGRTDLVTDADTASEQAVIDHIRNRFPDHGIMAEESGMQGDNTSFLWIIDPLDGTTNFAHGLPFFAVSIGISLDGRLLAGCVFNPVMQECFTAMEGKGACKNGIPISVSQTTSIEDSLLATGFPYSLDQKFDALTSRFRRCIRPARGIRRLGAASLDLCYVANGHFDGFWEEDLKPWDTAAGSIIAREAGALVTDFSGNPHHIHAAEILASNGRIHEPLRSLLELES
ncbi:inositol monophosphatase [Desulfobotulus sp. H1]|uniref:Inositol-1-monophosphatase n=1 Tax=Desulfobotulus pelophilus TaxID=2823377 RepID=A0ABT3N7Z7_9BACT|nr:inositol monophosphatase family protein [Desulfobotulus pelophilus]MCW7753582.1 inositol monophosphatase [Desulfobotulus pelophilus]